MTDEIQRFDWGDRPVEPFGTIEGSPYQLKLDKAGDAHFMVLAPAGRGMSSNLLDLAIPSHPSGDLQHFTRMRLLLDDADGCTVDHGNRSI